MSAWVLCLSVLAPLGLAMLWPLGRRSAIWPGTVAWAPLPALLCAGLLPDLQVDLAGLLLGGRWGLDTTGRLFLAVSAALWLAAGHYATGYLSEDPERHRFDFFHLLTMAGNLGVTVAQDMLSFLFFFTVMSLAALGLITHDRKPESLRAGRIYLTLAILGEVLLFWAVVTTALATGSLLFADVARGLADSPQRNTIAGLALVGFSIKLGLMPLHVWLPLAHPAAPTPASAVLSGAMIKTGLLGLIRFIPFAEVALPEWGTVCIALGVASAFLAVPLGMAQSHPKTVLAYSSIGQMGLIAVGIGIGLMDPQAWSLIRTALLFYVLHHGAAKAALFLGVGVAQTDLSLGRRRMWVTAGLTVAALSLAGLPLTSGFVAKNALKYVATTSITPWTSALAWLLPLSGLTTTLLMTRFLWLVWPGRQVHNHSWDPRMVRPWGVLTMAVVGLFVAAHFHADVDAKWVSLTPQKLWSALWPMLVALVIGLPVCLRPPRNKVLPTLRPPAGDLVVGLTLGWGWLRRWWHGLSTTLAMPAGDGMRRRWLACVNDALLRLSVRLTGAIDANVAAGVLIGILVAAMLILMLP